MNKFFQKLETVDLVDLVGKKVEIRVGSDLSDGVQTTVIAGYERSTGKYYVIAERTIPTEKREK